MSKIITRRPRDQPPSRAAMVETLRADFVFGDDTKEKVFAKTHVGNLTLVFKVKLDESLPRSLPSRVVSRFHDLETQAEDETYPGHQEMIDAFMGAIYEVWREVMAYPWKTSPEVTFEIMPLASAERGRIWRPCHEFDEYATYVEGLVPLYRVLGTEGSKMVDNSIIEHTNLYQVRQIGRAGTTALVRKHSRTENLYGVFKGIDFALYLQSPTEFRKRRDNIYHEIRTIRSMSKHLNIVQSWNIFVYVKEIKNDVERKVICGTLSPYMERGSLAIQVDTENEKKGRFTLPEKAKWCSQIASAVAHAHFTNKSFYMDLKLSNILLTDEDKDVILIGWEQSEAPLCTLPPEADGSLHAVLDEAAGDLRYERYYGPSREDLNGSLPRLNIFPIWRESCPRALEAAEVFSLGRAFWMLLQQTPSSQVRDKPPEKVPVEWTEETSDIPEVWKMFVGKCVEYDPNKRIRLRDVVVFWNQVLQGWLRF